jgi:hypothetical protein
MRPAVFRNYLGLERASETNKAAGGVLTAKQAPIGPAPLAALGLRARGDVLVMITQATLSL